MCASKLTSILNGALAIIDGSENLCHMHCKFEALPRVHTDRNGAL